MNRKISSDLTKIFQIAAIVKFITLSIVFFIVLFLSDFNTRIIILICWILGLLIFRLMGITKLKTVFWHEDTLIIKDFKSEQIIPLSNIKDVNRTFLFDDFPYRIRYTKSGKIEKLYFLPKSKLFQYFLSENEIIMELKKEIKRLTN